MQDMKEQGGLAIPNFKRYYQTCYLTGIIVWVVSDEGTGYPEGFYII